MKPVSTGNEIEGAGSMSYTYPIEPEAMFEDRAAQFVAFGVPAADVERMRSAICDMWSDGPGARLSIRYARSPAAR